MLRIYMEPTDGAPTDGAPSAFGIRLWRTDKHNVCLTDALQTHNQRESVKSVDPDACTH